MKFSLEGKLLKGLRQYRKLIRDSHWWNRRELVRYNTRTKPVTHPSTTDFVLDSDRIWGLQSSYKPRLTGEY